MSEAPERIWVDIDDEQQWRGAMIGRVFINDLGDVEYIRADLAAAKDARIADLERQLANQDARIVQMTAAWGEDALRVEDLTRQLAEASAEVQALPEALVEARIAELEAERDMFKARSERYVQERNEALNLNSMRAQQLASAWLETDRVRAELDTRKKGPTE